MSQELQLSGEIVSYKKKGFAADAAAKNDNNDQDNDAKVSSNFIEMVSRTIVIKKRYCKNFFALTKQSKFGALYQFASLKIVYREIVLRVMICLIGSKYHRSGHKIVLGLVLL